VPHDLLLGKRLLVTGVATPASLATAVARRAVEEGAQVVLTAFPRDLDAARDCARSVADPPPLVVPVDLTDPAQRDAATTIVRDELGGLDGALHAVAFAPRPALSGLRGVEAEAVEVAFRTSVHSYVALGEMLAELSPGGDASLVGLDFDAHRAWPVYHWMGVCKAALRTANRYLARELGPEGLRANLVAAGPLATRAASGIPGFEALTDAWAHAPLGWDASDPGPVADVVTFLLSDLARAVTGEVVHVDGGFHAVEPVGAPVAPVTAVPA
jgi:enoyl-[acyl-carrier protein] reductase I